MRTLIFLSILLFPVFVWAQQDCKEKPSDLESKTAIQIDTTWIIDPETYDQTIKLTHIYQPGERPIVELEKVGNKTYFYVEKNDCYVIRYVEQFIEK
jgi:hypothetical protein